MNCSDAKRRVLLKTIGNELISDELSTMKFVLSGVVPDGKLQKCTTGASLLFTINENGGDEHIVESLARAGRKDLAARYSEECGHEGAPRLDEEISQHLGDLSKTHLKEFRVILVYIADELTDMEDLPELKSIATDIPTRALKKAHTVLDFLNLLIKEKILEPHTLDSALLDPLQNLRITNWMKKHSGKISQFKERLALRAAEEIEGSRFSPPVAEYVPGLAETQDTQNSEDENASQDQPQENAQELSKTQDFQNCEDGNESQNQSPENEENVAESEQSQENETEEKIPEQSPENVTHNAETEGSNDSKGKAESHEQLSEKGQNGSESGNADTKEEGGSSSDPDEDVLPEHSSVERERYDTGFDHINMTGFIDRKHRFSSWPNRASKKVHETTLKHYKVYRPVENVRLPEYRMTRKPRGKAVIFNIEKFRKIQSHAKYEHLKDRTGSSIDAAGLVKVFTHLHFDVERFDDFTFLEINSRLRNLGEETDHENVDCIAIFILTHGENGKLLDVTGSPFDLAPLRNYFHASKCVTLAGKPKMFFIQACQGPASQGSYNHLEKDTVIVKTSPKPAPTQPETQSPDEADFLICKSSSPGYVSYRDTNTGSWFISTFIEILERDRNSFDILEILARTNQVLGNKTGSIDGVSCAQIASITTTLRKKLFLRTITSN